MSRILVTGATGNVGRRVTERLAARGSVVRALVRDPETARLPDRVEVVAGDLAAPESLGAALSEVGTVFLIWPLHSAAGAEQLLKVLAGAVRRVVYLSSSTVNDAGPQSDPIPERHAELERVIEASGVAWTVLRADTIASNALAWAGQIRETGVVRATEVAPTAVVHEDDIAAVAAEVLADPTLSGRKYILTGPRVVGRDDQVQAIAAAIGRPLRFEALPLDVARTQMTAAGLPRELIDTLLAMAEFRPRSELVTTTVEEITGTPARDIREWAIEHAAHFR
ncbi:NmrA family NAD(P)-binding protein [Nocardia inohanensis]|uniref:NmrA family NAD(P)-binding protein n=1 Tax=Nocardia inohanensis TaxID=209246 RepID=UPI001C3FF56B|nr:NAD(P)H-binding protein [Nocardia inohanensis]